jgi:hypothetical protein
MPLFIIFFSCTELFLMITMRSKKFVFDTIKVRTLNDWNTSLFLKRYLKICILSCSTYQKVCSAKHDCNFEYKANLSGSISKFK